MGDMNIHITWLTHVRTGPKKKNRDGKRGPRKKYDAVVGKFDAYFEVRRNTIFERARFNRRSQREGESAEQYITELYELIEFCEYGDRVEGGNVA